MKLEMEEKVKNWKRKLKFYYAKAKEFVFAFIQLRQKLKFVFQQLQLH